ncbi:MAG: histidine kinase N-terminal domain-containing protein, partial [Anaerolineae bacterium]|nr:histidine kinase N-terminal domain-containing protein [Anaerolineae bacterium]
MLSAILDMCGQAEDWEERGMEQAVAESPGLSASDRQILERIVAGLPILADIAGADLLIYRPVGQGRAVVVAQAGPHSVPPIYDEPLSGQIVTASEKPAVLDALESGSSTKGTQGVRAEGAPVVQEAQPIYGLDGTPIAALSVEKTMIEYERHRHRPIRFRKTLESL